MKLSLNSGLHLDQRKVKIAFDVTKTEILILEALLLYSPTKARQKLIKRILASIYAKQIDLRS